MSGAPRPRALSATLLPVIAGVVAGVVTSLVVHRPERRSDASNARPAEIASAIVEDETGETRSWERVKEMRLAAMEQRLGALEASTPPPAAPAEDPPAVSVGADRARIVARHEATIAKHQADPVDPDWAGAATTTLREDLGTLEGAQGLHLREVDCRTTSCLASVEWPSYEAAADSYGSLLTRPLRLNCEREVVLDEPQPGAAGFYRTTVAFSGCVRTGS